MKINHKVALTFNQLLFHLISVLERFRIADCGLQIYCIAALYLILLN